MRDDNLKHTKRQGGKRFKSDLLTGDKVADRKARKKLLIDLGITSSEIGRRLGVSSQHVSHTVNAKENNRRILAYVEALAEELR